MTIDIPALFATFLATPTGQALLATVLIALASPAVIFILKMTWRVMIALLLIVPRRIRHAVRQRELML